MSYYYVRHITYCAEDSKFYVNEPEGIYMTDCGKRARHINPPPPTLLRYSSQMLWALMRGSTVI